MLIRWQRLVGLAVVIAVWGCALLFMERARASCAAPTQCLISEVVVTSCAALDPEKESGIARYLDVLRKEKPPGRVRPFLDAYRGVIVQVQEKKRTTVDCKRGLPKGSYDEAGHLLTGGSLTPTPAERAGQLRYYVQTKAADVCDKRFPAKRELRMHAAFSCCDGDPGPPCLISRE